MPNERIYKYYSPSEYNLDALFNKFFLFSKRENLNDPFDLGNFRSGRKVLAINDLFDLIMSKNATDFDSATIIKSFPEYASCSFTNNPLNKQMWAYYAKDYSGWCVHFEVGELKTKNPSPLTPVIYVDDKLSQINNTNMYYKTNDIETIIRKILCTKHESWKHEQEKRIIVKMNNGKIGDSRRWGTYRPIGITIGNKINSAYRSLIQLYCKNEGIPLYEVALSTTDFSLTQKELYNIIN